MCFGKKRCLRVPDSHTRELIRRQNFQKESGTNHLGNSGLIIRETLLLGDYYINWQHG